MKVSLPAFLVATVLLTESTNAQQRLRALSTGELDSDRGAVAGASMSMEIGFMENREEDGTVWGGGGWSGAKSAKAESSDGWPGAGSTMGSAKSAKSMEWGAWSVDGSAKSAKSHDWGAWPGDGSAKSTKSTKSGSWSGTAKSAKSHYIPGMPPPNKNKHSPLYPDPVFECETYEVSNVDLLYNTAITRPPRIDNLPGLDLCTSITGRFGETNILGDEFCVGDTFATGAVPLYEEGGITGGGSPIGFYVSQGSRVRRNPSAFPDKDPIVTSRIDTLYFDGESTYGANQIMYMGLVNFDAGQPFYYAVTGGTGDFIGASGQVAVNNFIANIADPVTIEVCLKKV